MDSSYELSYISEDIECLVCKKSIYMLFGMPMIWRDQKDRSNDCYFCRYDFTGCTTAKKKKHIVCPNLKSAMYPVEHLENLPVPKPPDQEIQSPRVLMNIQVVNMWSPMIQKTRINQYHCLKRF